MSLWKRSMDYLGLGPDDAYDDYDEPEPAQRQSRAPREPDSHNQGGWEPESEPTVRTVSGKPSFPSRDFDASPSRRSAASAPGVAQGSNGRNDDSGVNVRPSQPQQQPQQNQQPNLRSVPGGAMEPHTVRPRRFDQAQEVADKFKDGQPVIMNIEGTERDVARRLIDFASGICYALDGSMEKVATGVYLLKPPQPRYDQYGE